MREREGPKSFGERLRDFFWGLFAFDLYRENRELAARQEDALLLIIYGELLGLPLMNSVFALRLLPYVLPELEEWKKRQLAEPDVIEHVPDSH